MLRRGVLLQVLLREWAQGGPPGRHRMRLRVLQRQGWLEGGTAAASGPLHPAAHAAARPG